LYDKILNQAIDIAKKKSMEIIYIKQEYKNNPLDLLISSGKYRSGTEGVQMNYWQNKWSIIYNRPLKLKFNPLSFTWTNYKISKYKGTHNME
jgi:hypothetical protein